MQSSSVLPGLCHAAAALRSEDGGVGGGRASPVVVFGEHDGRRKLGSRAGEADVVTDLGDVVCQSELVAAAQVDVIRSEVARGKRMRLLELEVGLARAVDADRGLRRRSVIGE